MLWINLILMRIRILDPHRIKRIRIRIQVISLKFTKFSFYLFSIFILKPFRNKEIFKISLFSKVKIWVLGVNKFFSVFGSYVTPWIRLFLRIRIQEAKILWIQRIRILSTAISGSLRSRGVGRIYMVQYDLYAV